ncbi:PREDICTED: H/ACA ribonucleoprotein complex subunit 1-like [Haliaeetus leucocephalus]|uniref:H/ACA ribonucleoprotein complex subunit 1-like n=1 Tax=Haliaeetus leucocephalus TaxID=52644 RepID=UPI00053CE835|nr:PREDICTED: H/ACA ribonucleoprotein complex subunit 1-like [Haliaeetus leucocephalus]
MPGVNCQAIIRSCLKLSFLYRDLEKNQPGGGGGGVGGRFCNIVADLPSDKTDPARDHFTYPTSVRVGFRVPSGLGAPCSIILMVSRAKGVPVLAAVRSRDGHAGSGCVMKEGASPAPRGTQSGANAAQKPAAARGGGGAPAGRRDGRGGLRGTTRTSHGGEQPRRGEGGGEKEAEQRG